MIFPGSCAIDLAGVEIDFKIGNHPTIPKLEDGSRDILWKHSHITTWKSLEALPSTGKARSVGVANYSVAFLEELLSSDIKTIPAVNQVENHPYLPQEDLLAYCRSKGIHITAYSPLGSTGSPLMQLEPVKKVASKYSVEPGNVLISWAGKLSFCHVTVDIDVGRMQSDKNTVARGNSVVPKSVNPARIEKNLKIIDLKEEDLKTLEEVTKDGVNRYIYPAFGVDLKFPDKS